MPPIGALRLSQPCSMSQRSGQRRPGHLAALGCPVAGDRKYGYRPRPGDRYPRVMLHSWSLKLAHPIYHHRVAVTCDPGEAELQA